MFSSSFLHILIVVALIWVALGALLLLGLLCRDLIRKQLW